MRLLKTLLIHPHEFFGELKSGRVSLAFASVLYWTSAVLGAVFYIVKPRGFPEDNLIGDIQAPIFAFWPTALLLGFFLTVAASFWIKISLRFIEGKDFSLGFRDVALVVFSSHVYYLFLFAFLALACLWRAEALYKISELFFSLASLVFVISGIRAISGSNIGKIFLSVFVASLANAALLYALFLGGILPADMFKALLFS